MFFGQLYLHLKFERNHSLIMSLIQYYDTSHILHDLQEFEKFTCFHHLAVALLFTPHYYTFYLILHNI